MGKTVCRHRRHRLTLGCLIIQHLVSVVELCISSYSHKYNRALLLSFLGGEAPRWCFCGACRESFASERVCCTTHQVLANCSRQSIGYCVRWPLTKMQYVQPSTRHTCNSVNSGGHSTTTICALQPIDSMFISSMGILAEACAFVHRVAFCGQYATNGLDNVTRGFTLRSVVVTVTETILLVCGLYTFCIQLFLNVYLVESHVSALFVFFNF